MGKMGIMKDDGKMEYFVDVISAAKLLGVSRRTLDSYLKRFEYQEGVERKFIGKKVYLSEALVSRLWIYSRRNENYSAYPNNRGSKSPWRKKEFGIEVDDKYDVMDKDGVWIRVDK